jgi:hypothetical protein
MATSTAVHCVDITCVAKESRKIKERIWKDLDKTHKKKKTDQRTIRGK